jgi:hypothetical protein
MKTQSDQKLRTVSLDNLHAMCERISGWSRAYRVESVSRSRCHVSYCNPDEYGSPRPIVAVLPVLPGWLDTCRAGSAGSAAPVGDRENPRIVLEPLRYLYVADVVDPWQEFLPLLDCPTLWRTTAGVWRSHREERASETGFPRSRGPCQDLCTVCDLPKQHA